MSERPNFLFIITDQQRADHLGCYGNQLLRTPFIDGIARKGVRFDRFFVANPICMPNRATIMTGRMPSLHGVRHNGIPLALNQTTFVELLRAAGYRTALIGKSHLQNFTREAVKFPQTFAGGKTPPPFDLADAYHGRLDGPEYNNEQPDDWLADSTPDVQLPFYGFDHVELCTWHGDMVGGHYLRWLKERDPSALAQWGAQRSESVPGYSAPQARKPRIPPELYPSSYVAERTIDFLENYASKGEQSGFFLQCSFPDPHHPFTPPGKYWDLYSPESIRLPPSFYRPSIDQIPLIRGAHERLASKKADRGWVGIHAVSEREAKEINALTYGMISLIDDCVGSVLSALDRLDLRRRTIVVFTSDHGDWMGDHGLILKGPLHFRGLIRVPFIWSDPKAMSGKSTAELASSLDIARTILDRAGLAPYNGIQGQSLLGMIDGGEKSQHDGLVIEQTTSRPIPGYDRPVRVLSFVDHDWRLTLWPEPESGELYNLAADPYEMKNLWNDAGSADRRADLTHRMLRKVVELQDWAPLQTYEA